MARREQLKPGDLVDGKYRVDRILGQGGMGVVLAATDIRLERNVAIKVLLPNLADDHDFLSRFSREARAAVRLTSEHAVRVHEVGELDDKTPYIVMEYLVGRDLGVLLEEEGRLRPSEAVDYVLQATEAIADAHAAGIVHRDIKPPNLFLTRRTDQTPLIKVLDFGLAKGPAIAGQSLTRDSAVFGSPQYMSPEQLRGSAHVDHRTDIWALGASLYQLLSGVLPFEAATVPELGAMIMRDPAVPPHERCPGIPVGLSKVVMRCLEKDPRQRYADVAEFAAALEPFGSPNMRQAGDRVGRVLHVTAATLPTLPQQRPPIAPAHASAITVTEAVLDNQPSHARRRALWAAAGGAALAAAVLATTLLVTRGSATKAAITTSASAAPAAASAGPLVAELASTPSTTPIAPSASVATATGAPVDPPPASTPPSAAATQGAARPGSPTRAPVSAPPPVAPSSKPTRAQPAPPSPAQRY